MLVVGVEKRRGSRVQTGIKQRKKTPKWPWNEKHAMKKKHATVLREAAGKQCQVIFPPFATERISVNEAQKPAKARSNHLYLVFLKKIHILESEYTFFLVKEHEITIYPEAARK